MPHLGDIRRVADALFQYQQGKTEEVQGQEADWDEVLDRLCWLAVDCCKSGEIWTGWYRYRTPKLGLSILSAATYFGYASLAQDLLNQGHDPTTDDGLFPCPMYIAARTGQADMLRLLQEHLPQFQHDTQDSDPASHWPSKIGASLPGACARGDLEIARLCLYPPSRVIPGEGSHEEGQALIHDHKPGSIPPNTRLSGYIITSMIASRSAEVYQYLDSLVSSPRQIPPYYLPFIHLRGMAQAGDLAMVKFQLDTGAIPASLVALTLAEAVRACNHDIVDLLLERGADPNYGPQERSILLAATLTGSMTMVRKLIDAGAKCFEPDTDILLQAVKLEHTAMVEMLLDMGLGYEGEMERDRARTRALGRAKALGLESMVNLLGSRRVTRDLPQPGCEEAAKTGSPNLEK